MKHCFLVTFTTAERTKWASWVHQKNQSPTLRAENQSSKLHSHGKNDWICCFFSGLSWKRGKWWNWTWHLFSESFLFSECVLCPSRELLSYKGYQFPIWVALLLKPWGSKLNDVPMMPAFRLVLFRWCIFSDADRWGLGQLATFCDWIWFQTTNYHDWKKQGQIENSDKSWFWNREVEFASFLFVQCGEFEFLAFLFARIVLICYWKCCQLTSHDLSPGCEREWSAGEFLL